MKARIVGLTLVMIMLIGALSNRTASAADPNDWTKTGNSGTTAGTNFVGTTDNVALEIKVNSTRVMRFEPTSATPNVIGGYSGNTMTSGVTGGAIAGGGESGSVNKVTDMYGFVGGGSGNVVGNNTGTTDDVGYGAIVGGALNTASSDGSFVGAGQGNVSSNFVTVIGGGYLNTASGYNSAILGGQSNTTSGSYSMAVGGYSNTASGDYTFASGRKAQATHAGSFVWADSNNFNFASTANNEFSVRSTGGARIVTGINGSGGVTAGVSVAAGGGSWSSLSDRNAKSNFAAVNNQAILDALAAIPIQTWNYNSQAPEIRHIGPVAQDFRAAFGVGEDDTHITTIDADGVALAAIQALNTQSKSQDSEIATLKARIAALESGSAAPETAAPATPAAQSLTPIYIILGVLAAYSLLMTLGALIVLKRKSANQSA